MLSPVDSTTTASSSSTRPIPRRILLIAAALLAFHFAFAVGSKLQESTTTDEIVHLTAGVSYWQHHDYRLHPENGILPMRWASLPTWLAGATFPQLEGNDYWRLHDAWVIGHQFFYETKEDHFPRLMAGRAMIALFSVATGLLIFLWSHRLFGDAGAMVSLGFFVFCPDFLAHGALVTSDVCVSFFFLAASGAWWRHLHDPRPRAWWLSASALGLAFVAKYSALLLLPVMVITAAVRIVSREPLVFLGRRFVTKRQKTGTILLSALCHGMIVIFVIWAFYGFRYRATNPCLPPAEIFDRMFTSMEANVGAFRLPVEVIHKSHLLPEGFLYGFVYVMVSVAERGAFLNGKYSLVGWPTFFIWTFLLKTTAATLAAGVFSSLVGIRSIVQNSPWRRYAYLTLPLSVFFIIYWITSITSHLNIGHRHLLPVYPAIFIGLGALGRWCELQPVKRIRTILVGILLGWNTVSTLSVAPHFLAYFNEFAGGPENGWRHLVDSSLDWGQDLPGLKRWLDANAGREPIYLSYFGTGEPGYYSIPARRLPFMNNFKFAQDYVKLEPGVYCVSATMLQQVYGPTRGGKWAAEQESEYQQLRQMEWVLEKYSSDPDQQARLERDAPKEQWLQAIRRFEILRFARLCCYLRVRQQDANIGHSIFIFRLSAAEIADATGRSLYDWSALIERTVTARR